MIRRRLDKTLGDYVAIAISPALIMLMVGSLLYFLVEVFYQGRYEARLLWILACFTLAIVLIARISIEEGKERAMLFGLPLALVTAMAIRRFVEFQGGGFLTRYNMLVNLGLMALIWWAAHKLTWDCTVIDEREDDAGEGLMQTVGLDEKAASAPRDPDRPKKTEPDEPGEPEGVTSRDADPLTWFQRFLEREKRPHAPGVWVVYFSLAALPLFGIGQWFVSSADQARRLYLFQLLLVYVASGLGLLLSTSFLGMRRYLRQRHVEMPPAMAGTWIAVGCAFIVTVLALAAVLPRPNAEYEVARLSFRVGSPTRQASRHDVMGGEAADEDADGRRSGSRGEEHESDSPDSREGGRSGSESDSHDQADRSKSQAKQGGSGSGEKAEQNGSGEPEDGGSGSDAQSQGDAKSQQGRQSGRSGQEHEPKSPEPGTKSGEQGGQKGEQGEQGEQKDQPKGGESDSEQGRRGRESKSQQDGRSPSESEQDGRQKQSPSNDRGQKQEAPSRWARRMGDRETGEPDDESEPAESRADDEKDEGGASRPPRRSFDPTSVVSNVGQWGAALLKWLIFAILIGVVVYYLWRSRGELLQALKDLLRGWREFWARLFGGRSPAPEQAGAAEGPRARPERPFSDYPNPFSTGLEHRFSPDELVQYSFEALEAWGREHGCPRAPDQTPHEYAQQLGARVESLAQDVRRLADLYCRVAYAPRTLPRSRTAPLEPLWRQLCELEWAPV